MSKAVAISLILIAGQLLTGAAVADARIDAVRAALRDGDTVRAETMAEALVDAEPESADAHHLLGEVLVVRIGEVSFFRKPRIASRMRRAWERAIELEPEHVDAHMALMRYYLNAPAIAGGSDEKARGLAKRIAAIDRVAGFRAHAALWLAQDEPAQAVEQYRLAVEAFPDDLDLRFDYGLHLQRAEDWDTAYATFTGIIDADPARMDAHYQVGRNAVLSGTRLDEGIAALERYLAGEPAADDPSKAWAHTRLGQIHLAAGRDDDARAQFDAALALEPAHEEAKRLWDSLR